MQEAAKSQPSNTAAGQGNLQAWLAAAGFPLRDSQPLTGDVSLRRYTRLVSSDGATAILASYPPEMRATCSRFLLTGELLRQAGVPVPQVLACSCDEGWMLLEDLGPETLGEWGRGRPWNELSPFFQQALELAERIRRIPAELVAGLNPRLGRELLRKELAQTWDLFLAPQELTGNAALTHALGKALDDICIALDAETSVSCHRDFMVRNLMPAAGGGLVVLDHQDLRLGPPAYDIASLLNDTLFPPAELEEGWLNAVVPEPGERERYHRAAAQRTLKAVGTYTAFARRGADRHLPLVPPTLRRSLFHLARLPESAHLAEDLERVWAPVLQPAEP